MAVAKTFASKYPVVRFLRESAAWLLLWYFRFFAKRALAIHRPTIIGIAGAVGKSTAKQVLGSILVPISPTLVVDGNSETGIPLGILNLPHHTYSPAEWVKNALIAPFRIFSLQPYTYMVIEYGIDGPKAPKTMKYLLSIVTPDIALLLNESPAHVGNYENTIGQGKERQKALSDILSFMTEDDGHMLLAKTVRMAVVNADDSLVYSFAKNNVPKEKLYTVGSNPSSDIHVSNHYVDTRGTHIFFTVHTHQIKEVLEINLPDMVITKEGGVIIGSAILAVIHLGVSLENIKEHIERYFTLPPSRGSLLHGVKESIIIDSSYNASSASVISFLRLLKTMKKDLKRKTVFLCGDMVELGMFSHEQHLEVAKEFIGVVDYVYLVGPLTRQYVLSYAQKHEDKFSSVAWFAHAKDAGRHMHTHMPSSALVLVKGSQFLEEGIKLLIPQKDWKKLCRQSDFWKEVKKKRGEWVG